VTPSLWSTSRTGLLPGVLAGLLALTFAMSAAHAAPLGLPALLGLGVALVWLGRHRAALDLDVHRSVAPACSGPGSPPVVSRQSDPDAAGRTRARAPGRSAPRPGQPRR